MKTACLALSCEKRKAIARVPVRKGHCPGRMAGVDGQNFVLKFVAPRCVVDQHKRTLLVLVWVLALVVGPLQPRQKN